MTALYILGDFALLNEALYIFGDFALLNEALYILGDFALLNEALDPACLRPHVHFRTD
jgi:hypothetical protein